MICCKMDVILSEIGMHTQDQATLLEMAEGCGYWLSATEGRERFVHCESHSLLYCNHVEVS